MGMSSRWMRTTWSDQGGHGTLCCCQGGREEGRGEEGGGRRGGTSGRRGRCQEEEEGRQVRSLIQFFNSHDINDHHHIMLLIFINIPQIYCNIVYRLFEMFVNCAQN